VVLWVLPWLLFPAAALFGALAVMVLLGLGEAFGYDHEVWSILTLMGIEAGEYEGYEASRLYSNVGFSLLAIVYLVTLPLELAFGLPETYRFKAAAGRAFIATFAFALLICIALSYVELAEGTTHTDASITMCIFCFIGWCLALPYFKLKERLLTQAPEDEPPKKPSNWPET
jgi:Na+/melibiose symporter-like transporter